MKHAFEAVYRDRIWGEGSGEGSRVRNAGPYLKVLRRVIDEHAIRSVVDVGCGDWQLGSAFDWTGIDYTGIDVVASLVEHHQAKWGSATIRFRALDAAVDPLPPADLLIIKDVLQHWSHAAIVAFLPVLSRYRASLIVNGVEPGNWRENADIEDGDSRPLDLLKPPYNLPCRELVRYSLGPWLSFRGARSRKSVLLHVASPSAVARPSST